MKKNQLFTFLLIFCAHLFTAQSIDATFGTNGSLVLNNLGSFYEPTLTSDGKIIIPGVYRNGFDYRASLLKLNTDGTVDTTFGVNGKFEQDLYSGDDYYESFGKAKVLPDGKILVLYYYEFDNGIDPVISGSKLIRINANGTLDNTFSNAMGIGDNNYYVDHAVLSNGNILGITENSLRRILPNGSLDMSYGTSGIRTLTFNPENIFVNSNGIFLVDDAGDRFLKLDNESSVNMSSFMTGNFNGDVKMHNGSFFIPSNDTNFNSIITKIDSNLVPDPAFGVNGVFTIPQNSYFFIFGVQQDGSLLSGTNSYDNGTNIYSIQMRRINPNGTEDLSFGTQGVFTHNFTGYYYSGFYYHPILKKVYVNLEDDNNSNNAIVSRFNMPNEVLATQEIVSKNTIKILENPVKEVLTFSSPINKAVIFSASGGKTGISFSGNSVSVAHLPIGVYYILGVDDDGVQFNLKFIKK